MAGAVNRQWLLAARPAGEIDESAFAWNEAPVPVPGEGEVLVRNTWLSLDPYMRGRMREGKSYVPPVALGAVMTGGTVGEVVESRNPAFKPGDIVEERLGWQDYGISNGKALRKIDPSLAPISTALGILGMPGLTAYFGLLEVGQMKAGDTVVVSAASGAVGGPVGQIARIKGAKRVVGIAGGQAKCDYCTAELGFDACLDYQAMGRDTGKLIAALKAACPDGIDVYFDNVGSWISDAVYPLINRFARIAVCGMIAEYNLETPELAPRVSRHLLVNSARMEGFIVSNYWKRFGEGLADMARWLKNGELKYREDVVDGLENAPRALLRLFKSENFGKQLVRIRA
ncbi:MAG: NADP-dependent oxidoreductase [Rhodospirillaceae bacterium]|nr:NADP-dependent oxidoreductase [Rhodospirillaceae bacterium]